jgi:glyoxylase-like metal-dependent hydrolase (beta-lactamase superfamily II)
LDPIPAIWQPISRPPASTLTTSITCYSPNLHPDQAGGLISGDARAAFSHATVHAAKADADHWLDAAGAACATGVQRLVYETAARVLDPYRDTGRFVTFGDADEPIPGVAAVNLAGHSPGHTGYLCGRADETLLFWGDTVHNPGGRLRRPSVSTAADSDEAAAVASRPRVFDVVATNRWWLGGAHLPFPGLGHLRRDPDRYTWVPVTFTPVD